MKIYLNDSQPDGFDNFRAGAVYQIFPDRFARDESVAADRELVAWGSIPTPQNFFGGNLRGITKRLDYIADLGIKNIYFNPIFSAKSNHRYDAHDYKQIDPLLGDYDDFQQLVTAAKARGIGVVIDGVFNHVGDHYPNFVAAMNGDKELAKQFFIYPDGSYQTFGSAHSLPKLNLENETVLNHIVDVMEFWDKFEIAGWRFDVPYKVSNEVWEKLRNRTAHLKSAQFIVAEAWTDWTFAENFESVQNYKSGNRILDYSVHMRCDSEDFILDVTRYAEAWKDGSLLWNFIDSHDTARYLTQCREDFEAFLLGFALHMVMPGIPVVFSGTELAVSGENDPGCRTSFPVAFGEAQLKTLEITKAWIQLRQIPALTHGDLEVIELKNHAMIFCRKQGESKIEILVNTGYQDELLLEPITGSWKDVRHQEIQLDKNIVPKRSIFYRIN
ncbi:MAG: hypothetical protein RLZZ330_600 [Actinomycetota bacterium]|jgi:cyclomaltodextrinase